MDADSENADPQEIKIGIYGVETAHKFYRYYCNYYD